MSASESSRETNKPRRRATVASLLMLIALIALSLGGYRHASPWIAVRVAHPGLAPVSALFTNEMKSFRCDGCHSGATKSTLEILKSATALVAPPSHSAKMADCKSCHAR